MDPLTDSSNSPSSLNNNIRPSISPFSQRSILAIDLNQIPSPPETLPSPSFASAAATSSSSYCVSPTSLVRSFHDNPPVPVGPAAEIPDGFLSCAACGGAGAETAPDRIVCDACERGFHFACARIVASVGEEWVCRDCLREGVSSRRWQLGRTEDGSVRILDINASPPSDVDGVVSHSRKLCFRDNTYGGYASVGLLSYPNFIYSGNGFHKPSTVRHMVRLDFQDILHTSRCTSGNSEEIKYKSQLGRMRSSNPSYRLPSLNPSEVLKSLKDFVSERHGVLEEGWRVEFRQSKNGYETYAVYCAPDGKIFETMSDVASYLGLASNGNSLEPDTRGDDISALRRNGLHLPKRRKLTKLPIGNGLMENKDNVTSGFGNGLSSNLQYEHLSSRKYEGKSIFIEAVQEEKGANDVHQFHEGLPLQYEDFFVLSLGKADARALYHDSYQIWPVGFRSCWHDKITGSLFLCHVLDGGDSGPVFKVKRFPCSTLPIPYGSTILQRRCVQSDVPQKDEGDKINSTDEDCCIEMMLSDSCFLVGSDSLSWLVSPPNEGDDHNTNQSEAEAYSNIEPSKDQLACSSPVGDKIGEFSVDGNSPSLVWSILSQKVVDACRQTYKQPGSLKFFCKHAKEGLSSFYDVVNDKNKATFSALEKFCSLLGSLKVPSVVTSDDELDPTVDALKHWLSPDRFGLDVEFVQELVEQCPNVNKCSRYQSLKRRKDFSKLPLVRNGLLLINGKSLEQCQQDSVIDSLYKDYRISRAPARVIHSRPPGNHLGMKLPPHLVGDVLQAWEILCRFHGILSLESLKFDELEAELISPWFENSFPVVSCEEEFPGDHVVSADGSGLLNEQTSSSSGRIKGPEENRLLEIQKAAMREESHSKLALSTYSKCAGLRKAHMSLLDVLVSELQIKAAAMVDPSIDGESRSRRGRRKDVDSSILAIRPKLNLLPVNDITWPELARRYILAMLSMDGNPDSAETGIREFGNVFRCLQGDGGVLCGSLVGVAGIEADALLLSEAIKRIYGCPSSDNDHLIIEDDDPEPVSTSGMGGGGDGKVPEWAQVLEPVRKLPTNVGTRIRKCVYEALEKHPPDWARKKLEHSISKEVYKGNASGPTKKVVLSVLADAISEASEQKIIKERKKTILSISDIIMRKCRILLRLAASADNEKLFCNLLGRNLMNSSENDDEGLLGSPAMVSRPLDFRTIDLRLAVGAYCGFHEAFLEDVRELWKNIAVAHAEQSELVQLAGKLSQNFESLYQEEVVALVDKLKEYSKMEQLSPEMKKNIDDVLASTNDIPKAPWDEGVCKVCGIDKDDDSVLLCDTCDAEYHTYCLNPPLARIPEGNWYCPSCVSGVSIFPVSSKGVQRIGHRRRRKYRGDGIRNYLEELARLSTVMEQKDYWEFSVEERILLLKFLCDDVLNTIVIRQHLELCFETSADLQQKLRTSYSEWKSLKLREDMLAAKVTKLGPVISNITGDANLKVTDCSSCEEVQPAASEKCGHVSSISDNAAQASGANHVEKDVCKSQVKQQVDLECQAEHVCKIVKVDSASAEFLDLHGRPLKRQKSLLSHECSGPNPSPNETNSMDSESSFQSKIHEHHGLDLSAVCKSEDGVTVSGLPNGIAAENTSCSTSNELQALSDELKAVQKELSVLQQSIASAESQLLSFSIRMEYLGTDSSGRLYWAAAQTGAHPWVIVDCTMALQPRARVVSHAIKEGISFETSLGGFDGHRSFGGSSVSCPFVYGRECAHPTCSQWIYYQSEAEIRDLLKSLNDYDLKERELKDSILHWQKQKFHEPYQNRKEDQAVRIESASAERDDVPELLFTKAYNVLERKFGPLFRTETLEVVKKRSKRSRGTNDENLYRCDCLEPVWLSRNHCFSCHRTFYTIDEFDKHNDGKCQSCSLVSGKGNAHMEPFAGSCGRKHGTQQHATVVIDKVQLCKTAGAELSRFTKYQNEAPCPYSFEEISAKFVTKDSVKELVNGIGLIGNEGIPSFVTSLSPYLSDPMLLVKEGTRFATDQLKIPDNAVGQSNQIAGKGRVNNVADIYARRLLQNKNDEHSENGKPTPESRGNRPKKAAALPMVSDAYCTLPESSLKPVVGKAAEILRQLKICLLDMEAALPEESVRPWKVHPDKRRAWHAFVKTADTIFEMVQATIVLEDMIKSEFLKNEWWYWSSLSAAVKISTVSSLALRIFALDNAILYDRTVSDLTGASNMKSSCEIDQQSQSNVDSLENSKQVRRTSKRRRDADASLG